jgi:DNA-binding transcriptional regulator YiaG
MEYVPARRSRSARPSQRAEGPQWDAERLRALRRQLGLSQQALAAELGVRQQTVSEWETSAYRPRGASARLLSLVAERAGFQYQADSPRPPAAEAPNRGDVAKERGERQ